MVAVITPKRMYINSDTIGCRGSGMRTPRFPGFREGDVDGCLFRYFRSGAGLGVEAVREVRSLDWDGVEYPQEPASYNWRDLVRLTVSEVPGHVMARIPKGLAGKDWRYLSIDRPVLDQFERLVNEPRGDEECARARALEAFLRIHLVASSPWVLVFEPNCDQIDRVFEGEVDSALTELRASFAWSRQPEGFVVFHRPQDGVP
jgi:hypothetical protein